MDISFYDVLFWAIVCLYAGLFGYILIMKHRRDDIVDDENAGRNGFKYRIDYKLWKKTKKNRNELVCESIIYARDYLIFNSDETLNVYPPDKSLLARNNQLYLIKKDYDAEDYFVGYRAEEKFIELKFGKFRRFIRKEVVATNFPAACAENYVGYYWISII